MPIRSFEWDDAKRASNIARHGIDFLSASGVFDGRPSISVRSGYQDEERFVTVALIDERFVTVVWTYRDDTVRIISARRSRTNEKRNYYARFGQ